MLVRPCPASVTKSAEIRNVTKQSSDAAGEMMDFYGWIADDILSMLTSDRATNAPRVFWLRQEHRR